MENLTPKQRKVLGFVSGRIQSQGIPPTVREIGDHFSIFPRAVQDHLAALERKGVLRRIKDQARGLVVAGQKMVGNLVRLPVLGSVPAGAPLEAINCGDDFLAVDEALAKRANFMLRVKGDSMFPSIWDGDLLLVQSTPTAENGEVVVACVDGEDATVKTLRMDGGDITLEAINPAYAPITDRPITIVGRVTGLIRPFFKA